MICKIKFINGVAQYGIAPNGKKSILFETLKNYNPSNIDLFRKTLGLKDKTDEDITKNYVAYLYQYVSKKATKKSELDINGEPVVDLQDDVYLSYEDKRAGIFTRKSLAPRKRIYTTTQVPVIRSKPFSLLAKSNGSTSINVGDYIKTPLVDNEDAIVTGIEGNDVYLVDTNDKRYLLDAKEFINNFTKIGYYPVVGDEVVTGNKVYTSKGTRSKNKYGFETTKYFGRGIEFHISTDETIENPNVVVLENPTVNDLYKYLNNNRFVIIVGSQVLNVNYRREILNLLRRDYGQDLKTSVVLKAEAYTAKQYEYFNNLLEEIKEEYYQLKDTTDLPSNFEESNVGYNSLEDGVTHYNLSGVNDFTQMVSMTNQLPFTFQGNNFVSLAHALMYETYSEALDANPGMKRQLLNLKPEDVVSYRRWLSTKIKANANIAEDLIVNMMTKALYSDPQVVNFIRTSMLPFTSNGTKYYDMMLQAVNNVKNNIVPLEAQVEPKAVVELKKPSYIKGRMNMAMRHGDKGHFFTKEITDKLGENITAFDALVNGLRQRSTRTGNFLMRYPHFRDLKPGDIIEVFDNNRTALVSITDVYDSNDSRWKDNWYKEGWIESNYQIITGTQYTNDGLAFEMELVDTIPIEVENELLEERSSTPTSYITNTQLKELAQFFTERLGVPHVIIYDPNDNKRAWYDSLSKVIYFNTANAQFLSTPFHEFWHPVILQALNENKKLFNSLLNEVKRKHNNVWKSVQKIYADKSDSVRDQEAIVHVLTKLSTDPEFLNEASSSLKDIINKIFNILKNLIKRLLGDIRYYNSVTKVTTVRSINSMTSLEEMALMFNRGLIRLNDTFDQMGEKLTNTYEYLVIRNQQIDQALDRAFSDFIEDPDQFSPYDTFSSKLSNSSFFEDPNMSVMQLSALQSTNKLSLAKHAALINHIDNGLNDADKRRNYQYLVEIMSIGGYNFIDKEVFAFVPQVEEEYGTEVNSYNDVARIAIDEKIIEPDDPIIKLLTDITEAEADEILNNNKEFITKSKTGRYVIKNSILPVLELQGEYYHPDWLKLYNELKAIANEPEDAWFDADGELTERKKDLFKELYEMSPVLQEIYVNKSFMSTRYKNTYEVTKIGKTRVPEDYEDKIINYAIDNEFKHYWKDSGLSWVLDNGEEAVKKGAEILIQTKKREFTNFIKKALNNITTDDVGEYVELNTEIGRMYILFKELVDNYFINDFLYIKTLFNNIVTNEVIRGSDYKSLEDYKEAVRKSLYKIIVYIATGKSGDNHYMITNGVPEFEIPTERDIKNDPNKEQVIEDLFGRYSSNRLKYRSLHGIISNELLLQFSGNNSDLGYKSPFKVTSSWNTTFDLHMGRNARLGGFEIFTRAWRELLELKRSINLFSNFKGERITESLAEKDYVEAFGPLEFEEVTEDIGSPRVASDLGGDVFHVSGYFMNNHDDARNLSPYLLVYNLLLESARTNTDNFFELASSADSTDFDESRRNDWVKIHYKPSAPVTNYFNHDIHSSLHKGVRTTTSNKENSSPSIIKATNEKRLKGDSYGRSELFVVTNPNTIKYLEVADNYNENDTVTRWDHVVIDIDDNLKITTPGVKQDDVFSYILNYYQVEDKVLDNDNYTIYINRYGSDDNYLKNVDIKIVNKKTNDIQSLFLVVNWDGYIEESIGDLDNAFKAMRDIAVTESLKTHQDILRLINNTFGIPIKNTSGKTLFKAKKVTNEDFIFEERPLAESILDRAMKNRGDNLEIVTDENLADQIHANYVTQMSKGSDYLTNLKKRIYKERRLVYRPDKNDSSVLVGRVYNDLMLVSHYAPSSSRKGIELLKTALDSKMPILFAVTDNISSMLSKLGFIPIGSINQPFKGRKVNKIVFSNKAVTEKDLELIRNNSNFKPFEETAPEVLDSKVIESKPEDIGKLIDELVDEVELKKIQEDLGMKDLDEVREYLKNKVQEDFNSDIEPETWIQKIIRAIRDFFINMLLFASISNTGFNLAVKYNAGPATIKDIKIENIESVYDEIKLNQDSINKLDNLSIIQEANKDSKSEYLVVDKRAGKAHLFKGKSLIESYNVGTGRNISDDQTHLINSFYNAKGKKVSPNEAIIVNKKGAFLKDGYTAKTDWAAGNMSTGAGIFSINKKSFLYGSPAFTLNNNRGIPTEMALHISPTPQRTERIEKNELTRLSNGCVNMLGKDIKELTSRKSFGVGHNVYVLPDSPKNKFQIVDGKLVFRSGSNKVNRTPIRYTPSSIVIDAGVQDKIVYTFINSLEANKARLMKLYPTISNDVYNEVAKIAYGITMQESGGGRFGTEKSLLEGYGLRGKAGLAGDIVKLAMGKDASVGIAQVRLKNVPDKVKEEFQFDETVDLLQTDNNAVAMMGMLLSIYENSIPSSRKADFAELIVIGYNNWGYFREVIKENKAPQSEYLDNILEKTSKVKIYNVNPDTETSTVTLDNGQVVGDISVLQGGIGLADVADPVSLMGFGAFALLSLLKKRKKAGIISITEEELLNKLVTIAPTVNETVEEVMPEKLIPVATEDDEPEPQEVIQELPEIKEDHLEGFNHKDEILNIDKDFKMKYIYLKGKFADSKLKLEQEYDLKDVITPLLKLGADSHINEMLKTIGKIPNDIKVIITDKGRKESNGFIPGRYIPTDKLIIISLPGVAGYSSRQNSRAEHTFIETLTHEATHAITANLITNWKKIKNQELKDMVLNLMSDISTVQEIIENDQELTYQLKGANISYIRALDNTHEFLSYFVSEEKFRRVIDSIDLPSSKKIELNFLNINTKNLLNYNKTTLSDRIFNSLSAIILKESVQLTDEASDLITDSLDSKVVTFYKDMGVTLEKIDAIKLRGLDIFGVTSVLDKLIMSTSDDSLAEESGHFLVELMGDSNPYINALLTNIHLWDEFKDVERNYSELYAGDDYRIRKEAIGKLIGRYIESDKNIPKNLITILKEFFNKLMRLFKAMPKISPDVIARDIALSFISNDYERLGITNVKMNMDIPEVGAEISRLRGLGAYYYSGLTGDTIELRVTEDIDAPYDQTIEGKRIIITKDKKSNAIRSLNSLVQAELGINIEGAYFRQVPKASSPNQDRLSYLNDLIRTQIEQRKQIISSSSDDTDSFVKNVQLNNLSSKLSALNTAENIRVYINDVYKTFTNLDPDTNQSLDVIINTLATKLEKRYRKLTNTMYTDPNDPNAVTFDEENDIEGYYETIKKLEYIYNYSRLFDDMITHINSLMLMNVGTTTDNGMINLYKALQLSLNDVKLTVKERETIENTIKELETNEDVRSIKNNAEVDIAYKLAKIVEIRDKVSTSYLEASKLIMSFSLTGIDNIVPNMTYNPIKNLDNPILPRPEQEIYLKRIAKLKAMVEEANANPTRFTKRKVDKAQRDIDTYTRLLNTATKSQIANDLEEIHSDVGLMGYLFNPVITSYDTPSALWAKRFRDTLYAEMDKSFATRDAIYDAYKEFSNSETDLNVEKLNKAVLKLQDRTAFTYNQTTGLYTETTTKQWKFISETSDEEYQMAKIEAYRAYNELIKKEEAKPYWKGLVAYQRKNILQRHYNKTINAFYDEWNVSPKSDEDVIKMINSLEKLYKSKTYTLGEYFNESLKLIHKKYKKSGTNIFSIAFVPSESEEVTLANIKRNMDILRSDIAQYGSSRVKKPIFKVNPEYTALSPKEKKYRDTLVDQYKQMQAKLPMFGRLGDYIPMIRKSMIDRIVAFEKGSDVREFFLGNDQDDVNDGIWGSRGLQTYGESGSKNIPVRFVGYMDPKDVSLNLPKVLTLFAKYSTYYEVADKLRPEATMMLTALKNRKVNTTDPMGNPIWNAAGVKNAIMLRVTDNNNNYAAAAFEAFIDRVIYGKTKKAEYLGSIRVDKVADGLMEFASKTQLGFNIPLDLTNMLFTNVNTIIEAIGGDNFTMKNWIAANKFYFSNAGKASIDHHMPVDRNILSAMAKTFDPFVGKILDKFGNHMGDGVLRQELSVNNLLFKTKEFAEHNGNMIPLLAILHKERAVSPSGKQVPLLGVLEMDENYDLKLREGFTLDGNEDLADLITRVRGVVQDVNRGIQGNYAWMDQTVVSTRAAGRLMQMYRKFIQPGLRRRYARLGYSVESGNPHEGYHMTFIRLALEETGELLKFLNPFKESTELTPKEKANIRKSIAELLFVTILALIVYFGYDDDDDERSKVSHFTQYVLMKTLREMSFYVNPKSAMEIVQNPSVIFTVMNNIYKTLYQISEDVVTYPLDGDVERYDRKTGIWEKGDPKWLAYFLRTLGLSGYTPDPEYAKEVLRKAGI